MRITFDPQDPDYVNESEKDIMKSAKRIKEKPYTKKEVERALEFAVDDLSCGCCPLRHSPSCGEVDCLCSLKEHYLAKARSVKEAENDKS